MFFSGRKKKEPVTSPDTEDTELVPGEQFCTLVPIEPSNLSLEEQGYTKISSYVLPQIGTLAQYVPGEAVALSNLGTYKAVFDKGLGVLQKSAKYPGNFVGNVVSPGSNNDIRAVAVWQEVSASPQLALSIFTAASVVTGQYFMAQMNSKLGQINQGIQELRQYLEAEDFSVLKTTEEYLQEVFSNLRSISENEVQRQSTLTRIMDRKLSCSEIGNKYAKIIEAMKMEGKTKEDLDSTFNSFSRYLSVHHYALHLYAGAAYLEMVLSQNTDSEYLRNLVKDIQDRVAAYQYQLFHWERNMNFFIDEAKALKRGRRRERRDPPAPTAALKEDSPTRYKSLLARYMNEHENLETVQALREEINKKDLLYNKPVEAVISDGNLYVRSIEAT